VDWIDLEKARRATEHSEGVEQSGTPRLQRTHRMSPLWATQYPLVNAYSGKTYQR